MEGLNPFFKGKRNFPWRGGFFLGGPRGDSESLLRPSNGFAVRRVRRRKSLICNRLVALCAPSSLRALQTTHNPPETAAAGACRPRRGATPATLRYKLAEFAR